MQEEPQKTGPAPIRLVSRSEEVQAAVLDCLGRAADVAAEIKATAVCVVMVGASGAPEVIGADGDVLRAMGMLSLALHVLPQTGMER